MRRQNAIAETVNDYETMPKKGTIIKNGKQRSKPMPHKPLMGKMGKRR